MSDPGASLRPEDLLSTLRQPHNYLSARKIKASTLATYRRSADQFITYCDEQRCVISTPAALDDAMALYGNHLFAQSTRG